MFPTQLLQKVGMQYVLIADDHPVTRHGIRQLLRDAFEGVEVIEVGDGDAALAELPSRPWDLILLDGPPAARSSTSSRP
jgi:DNA-binding NarL/FixJ family response regulator